MIWIWSGLAMAGAPEREVLERAEVTWSARAGRANQAEQHGAERAARQLAFGPSAVFVDSQVGERTQRQFQVGLEQPLDFGLARRGVARASAEVARIETEASRFQAQLAAHGAWSRWWTTRALVEHLEAHLGEMEAELTPFVAAAADGSVSTAALADLEAGVWVVRGELLDLQRALPIDEALAHQQLGDAPLPRGGSLDTALPEQNPWVDLEPAGVPVVAAARAAEARAAATEASHSRLPSLQAGVMWAPDGKDRMVPFATLGATLPLQTGLGAQRHRLRGTSDALSAQADWEQLQFAQECQVERVRWSALRDELVGLEANVVLPLAARAERLRTAAEAGLVPLSRWVQASRDHHEAEHTWLLQRAELLQSTSRAAVLKALLENEE